MTTFPSGSLETLRSRRSDAKQLPTYWCSGIVLPEQLAHIFASYTMTRQSARRPRPSTLRLESLEPRDAPATLVSPMKLTYQDADGDNVAVVFSKPILNATNV